MKVTMFWWDTRWVVRFGDQGNVTLETKNYKKAFFWVKYADQLNPQFVLDYMNNC